MGSSFSFLISNDNYTAAPSAETGLGDLPESCAASVLVYLDPPEICKLAILNRAFNGASSADFVWESKLPKNYGSVIRRVSGESENFCKDLCKRDIYSRLCRPNSFDGGTKKVWLDKRSGKICMSISWNGLAITGIDDRRYWSRIPTEESSNAYDCTQRWTHHPARGCGHTCWVRRNSAPHEEEGDRRDSGEGLASPFCFFFKLGLPHLVGLKPLLFNYPSSNQFIYSPAVQLISLNFHFTIYTVPHLHFQISPDTRLSRLLVMPPLVGSDQSSRAGAGRFDRQKPKGWNCRRDREGARSVQLRISSKSGGLKWMARLSFHSQQGPIACFSDCSWDVHIRGLEEDFATPNMFMVGIKSQCNSSSQLQMDSKLHPRFT